MGSKWSEEKVGEKRDDGEEGRIEGPSTTQSDRKEREGALRHTPSGIRVAGLVRADDPLFMSAAPNSSRVGSWHSPLLTTVSHRVGFRPVSASVTMSLISRGPATIHSKNSDFSIDHILNVAGGKPNLHFPDDDALHNKHFDWLNCTRYRPPKLPRQRKKEGVQRRSLGRNPRIPFSSSQVAFLEAKFLRTPYLSSNDVTQLASYLKLSETKVKIWFQNRRAREKRERETKSKAAQNSHKNHPSTPPHPPRPPAPTLPPPTPPPEPQPQPRHPSAPHYFTTPPTPYLQILPPLDLTQRRFISRPK